MKINIVTLFPDVFVPFFDILPFKRAIKSGDLNIVLWDLRDYAVDSYGSVDDKPYGGGKGMILRIEPIYNVLHDIKNTIPDNQIASSKTILLSPKGSTFNQNKTKELSHMSNLTFICGRYEGIDNRVEEFLVDETISVGDYVLSGGEVAALAVAESIVRLLPNVLEKEVLVEESFENNNIEYPQYTRPEEFKGWKVPEILLSGDHKKIKEWKKKHTKNKSQLN